MLAAYDKARATFKYLWRELTWEYRRIIPALGTAAVKAPFSDEKPGKARQTKPHVEHMWISDLFFDGRTITGRLLNTPGRLKSVTAGDEVSRSLDEISDWMYTCGDDVCGGFTVQLLRSKMGVKERKEHDAAWGLKFGNPKTVRLVPDWGGESADPDDEHPMSKSMAKVLKEKLAEDPTGFLTPDDNGWTTLHSMALGGSSAAVKVLLAHGADPNEKTGNGLSPLQLARVLGWEKVAGLLLKHGAKES